MSLDEFNPAALRELLANAIAGPIVGCVVGVSLRGAEPVMVAAGMSDRESGESMADDMVFRLASLTKAVTCVAALAMVEDGLIALDDAVSRWLPWFTPALPDGRQPEITLRHLMTHSSGLGYGFGQPAGNAYEAAGISDGLDDCGLSLTENMQRLSELVLFEAPGTAWRYSLGIDLLGLVMEVAAAQALAEIVAERVTRPLGMDNTSFVAAPDAILVTPYADATPPRRMKAQDNVAMGSAMIRFAPGRAFDSSAFPSGGTGLIGTAADYLRFLEAMRTGGAGVVSTISARQFVSNALGEIAVGMPGSGMGWGLGVAVWRDPTSAGSPLNPGSWSWGGVYGHSFWVDPLAELSVVALTNTAIAGMSGSFHDALKRAIYAGLG